MKTHVLAKALRELATVLEKGPNTEISDMSTIVGGVKSLDDRQVAVNLRTLHYLSKINKQDWVQLIKSYGFDIEIQPRDSSRNIIGKLLNYIDVNPTAIDVLKKKAKESPERPSALNKALDILLEDHYK